MTSAKELFAEISNQQVTDGGEVVGYFVKKSKMDLLEKYLSAPQLPAVTTEMAQAGGIVVAECEAHGEYQDDTARKVFAAMIAAAPKPDGSNG